MSETQTNADTTGRSKEIRAQRPDELSRLLSDDGDEAVPSEAVDGAAQEFFP